MILYQKQLKNENKDVLVYFEIFYNLKNTKIKIYM